MTSGDTRLSGGEMPAAPNPSDGMTLDDVLRAIAALPDLSVETRNGEPPPPETAEPVTPLHILSRQGRVILRLSAATESLEARYKELAAQNAEWEGRLAAETEARRAAERRGRRLAEETIQVMDTLDWIQGTLEKRDDALAREVAVARRDCLRRLAAVGVTEIPCEGAVDGRLHEAVDTVAASGVPAYQIVSVVRRGYQSGADVLRRAEVITAAS